MKNISFAICIFLITSFICSSEVKAQLRQDEDHPSDYSGPIIKKPDPSDGAKLGNLFNMKMSHSYSMMFTTFGGNYQNLNAYTNTMQFFFTPRLTGRVDLSLLHSPFGGNINGLSREQKGVQFLVRNAELDYDLSKNSSLHLQFNQVPSGYGLYRGYYNPLQSDFLFGQ